MKHWVIFLAVLVTVVSAWGNPDYGINVWISTKGTNVTYTSRHGPASLDEIKVSVKKMAVWEPSMAVHLIADERTTMAGLFTLSKAVYDAGLTNIVVSVFIDAHASQPSNKVEKIKGMSLSIHDVHDSELMIQ